MIRDAPSADSPPITEYGANLGATPSSAPNPVATPLPPRKRANTGQE